jgi:hypothetical protein
MRYVEDVELSGPAIALTSSGDHSHGTQNVLQRGVGVDRCGRGPGAAGHDCYREIPVFQGRTAKSRGLEGRQRAGIQAGCGYDGRIHEQPEGEAQKLAQEYAADKPGTRQNYHDKWLIVDGELANIDFKKGVATIKGEGEITVKAGFGAGWANLFKSVSPGRQLKLLSRATIFDSGTELFLESSLPITQKQ